MIFFCSLLSVVPLAYFIGTAVSSITAQTGSLALGAVVNATFGSIVEITLYALALIKGKERMVEGSIIGSFLCKAEIFNIRRDSCVAGSGHV